MYLFTIHTLLPSFPRIFLQFSLLPTLLSLLHAIILTNYQITAISLSLPFPTYLKMFQKPDILQYKWYWMKTQLPWIYKHNPLPRFITKGGELDLYKGEILFCNGTLYTEGSPRKGMTCVFLYWFPNDINSYEIISIDYFETDTPWKIISFPITEDHAKQGDRFMLIFQSHLLRDSPCRLYTCMICFRKSVEYTEIRYKVIPHFFHSMIIWKSYLLVLRI